MRLETRVKKEGGIPLSPLLLSYVRFDDIMWFGVIKIQNSLIIEVVGLGGFGPPSRAPEAHSLDQASRQPLGDYIFTIE